MTPFPAAMVSNFHPFTLADRQLEMDRVQTERWPALLAVKQHKMLTSPFATLRGSARLFHELIAAGNTLARLPTTAGWIVGDMHLENVGAYRNDEDELVFDLNDFDDAAAGPWALDVLRLATSTLLAGRHWLATGSQSIRLCHLMLQEHRRAAFPVVGNLLPPAEPKAVAQLIARTRKRTRQELLDARAPVTRPGGERRFQRGERYLELPPEVRAAVPDLLRRMATVLASHHLWSDPDAWKVVDAAQRVAGNGSLGCLRVAMVVRSRDGHERLVEFKEMTTSSVALASTPDPATAPAGSLASPAERVTAAGRALLGTPPRFLVSLPGALPGKDLVARQLFPQEDKLKLDKLVPGQELDELTRTVGFLLGSAHRRAHPGADARPWSDRELATIVEVAVELAGIHEALYLAFTRRCETGAGAAGAGAAEPVS